MKYLNYVFAIAITVLLLSGCNIFGDDGSDLEENKFKSYTIGDFEITSENRGEYIGSEKSKAMPKMSSSEFDTVDIYGPNDFAFNIVNDTTERGRFSFFFTDSTVSTEEMSVWADTRVLFPDRITGNPFGYNGSAGGGDGTYREMELRLSFRCDEADRVPDIYRILYKVEDDTTGFHQVYNIHAEGVVKAVQDVAC